MIARSHRCLRKTSSIGCSFVSMHEPKAILETTFDRADLSDGLEAHPAKITKTNNVTVHRMNRRVEDSAGNSSMKMRQRPRERNRRSVHKAKSAIPREGWPRKLFQ